MNQKNIFKRIAVFTIGYDIFISYRHIDAQNYAKELHDKLEEKGLIVFRDESEVDNSGTSTKRFAKLACSARCLVTIVTPNVYESESVYDELSSYFANRLDKWYRRPFSKVISINVDQTLSNAPNDKANWKRLSDFVYEPESVDSILNASPSEPVIERLTNASSYLKSWLIFNIIFLLLFIGIISSSTLYLQNVFSQIETSQNKLDSMETTTNKLKDVSLNLTEQNNSLSKSIQKYKEDSIKFTKENETLNKSNNDLTINVKETRSKLAQTNNLLAAAEKATLETEKKRSVAEKKTYISELINQSQEALTNNDTYNSYWKAKEAFDSSYNNSDIGVDPRIKYLLSESINKGVPVIIKYFRSIKQIKVLNNKYIVALGYTDTLSNTSELVTFDMNGNKINSLKGDFQLFIINNKKNIICIILNTMYSEEPTPIEFYNENLQKMYNNSNNLFSQNKKSDTLNLYNIQEIEFSPDGNYILCKGYANIFDNGRENKRAKVWGSFNMQDFKSSYQYDSIFKRQLEGFNFINNSNLIYYWYNDTTIKFINYETFKEERLPLTGIDSISMNYIMNNVFSLEITSTGKTLVLLGRIQDNDKAIWFFRKNKNSYEYYTMFYLNEISPFVINKITSVDDNSFLLYNYPYQISEITLLNLNSDSLTGEYSSHSVSKVVFEHHFDFVQEFEEFKGAQEIKVSNDKECVFAVDRKLGVEISNLNTNQVAHLKLDNIAFMDNKLVIREDKYSNIEIYKLKSNDFRFQGSSNELNSFFENHGIKSGFATILYANPDKDEVISTIWNPSSDRIFYIFFTDKNFKIKKNGVYQCFENFLDVDSNHIYLLTNVDEGEFFKYKLNGDSLNSEVYNFKGGVEYPYPETMSQNMYMFQAFNSAFEKVDSLKQFCLSYFNDLGIYDFFAYLNEMYKDNYSIQDIVRSKNNRFVSFSINVKSTGLNELYYYEVEKREIRLLKDQNETFNGRPVFSPNSEWLITSGSRGKSFWNLKTNQIFHYDYSTLTEGYVYPEMMISDNGLNLILFQSNGYKVLLTPFADDKIFKEEIEKIVPLKNYPQDFEKIDFQK